MKSLGVIFVSLFLYFMFLFHHLRPLSCTVVFLLHPFAEIFIHIYFLAFFWLRSRNIERISRALDFTYVKLQSAAQSSLTRALRAFHILSRLATNPARGVTADRLHQCRPRYCSNCKVLTEIPSSSLPMACPVALST